MTCAGPTRADEKDASTNKPPEIPPVSWPVAGIYTAPDTKDLGALTSLKWLEGVKVRGWIDGSYDFNFNTPSRATVNANPPPS